jgi:hypothetical protein
MLTWNDNASLGFVRAVVSTNSPSTNAYIECEFDATAQSGTIPHELLQGLPAGGAVVNVEQSCSRHVTAGAYTFVVDARSSIGDFENATLQ